MKLSKVCQSWPRKNSSLRCPKTCSVAAFSRPAIARRGLAHPSPGGQTNAVLDQPLLGVVPGSPRGLPRIRGGRLARHGLREAIWRHITAGLRPIERAIRTGDKCFSNPTVIASRSSTLGVRRQLITPPLQHHNHIRPGLLRTLLSQRTGEQTQTSPPRSQRRCLRARRVPQNPPRLPHPRSSIQSTRCRHRLRSPTLPTGKS